MPKTDKTAEKPSFWLSATKEQGKDTGLAVILICLILVQFAGQTRLVPLAMAVTALIMIWPGALRPLAKIWFGFSHVLGTVMSKLILSLTFFLVLTPMGLLRRLFGKDAMQVKTFKKDEASVFRVRDHTFGAADIEQPF